MVDSRLKQNPQAIYQCFLRIAAPKDGKGAKIEEQFPQEFDDQEEILKRSPEFSYPCKIDDDGVQYSTFVLTDIDSKFRYGFCRYMPHLSHCLVIVSYLQWFETFYSVLDKIAEFKDDSIKIKFLDILFRQPVPKPGSKLKFRFSSTNREMTFAFDIPDTTKLPSIPDNRNLTEYFAKVDPENMVQLFVSMLFERRIIVTSSKLSVLTAVIHGSISLLYPMQWQHIYVPILPPSLLPYCCAPMPFLVGIHSSMMEEVRAMPMDEVVIFNADTKVLELPVNDLKKFPSQVSSRLKRKLGKSERAFQNDYVSRVFLKALADLIGGYRDALIFMETKEGPQVIFNEEMFLESRTGELKDFLSDLLMLQSFQQFIRGRLDLLNHGVGFTDLFEQAVNERNHDTATEAKYKQWMEKARYEMKKGGGVLKKSVGETYTNLKGIDVKDVKNKIKKKVKDGYKGVTKYTQPKEAITYENTIAAERDANIKRNNSMPAQPKKKTIQYKDRHSMYHTLPRKDVFVPGNTPAPRPVRPARPPLPSHLPDHLISDRPPSSVELPRKDIGSSFTTSKSDPNICGHMDSSHSSLNDSNSSLGDPLKLSQDHLSDPDFSPHKIPGCFSNPAFMDPHDNYYELSTEDEVLEHTSLQNTNNYLEDDAISVPHVLPRGSASLKRNNYIKKTDRPNVPVRSKSEKPSRPPKPNLPKLRNEQDLIFEDNKFKDDFIIDNANGPERRSSIVLPNSPFYSPNTADLLGLDTSLFHETMLSLSEDTRSLVSREHSPSVELSGDFLFPELNKNDNNNISPGSSFENIHSNEVSPERHVDVKSKLEKLTLKEVAKKREETVSYEHSNHSNENNKSKTLNVDPFETFYEEAKRDLVNKSNKR